MVLPPFWLQSQTHGNPYQDSPLRINRVRAWSRRQLIFFLFSDSQLIRSGRSYNFPHVKIIVKVYLFKRHLCDQETFFIFFSPPSVRTKADALLTLSRATELTIRHPAINKDVTFLVTAVGYEKKPVKGYTPEDVKTYHSQALAAREQRRIWLTFRRKRAKKAFTKWLFQCSTNSKI